MAQGFFVTGTDTGVGKTLVACALLQGLSAAGKSAVGMKPVAAGRERDAWEDVEALARMSTVRAPKAFVNPYAFDPPIAPHIAAELAGVEIDTETVATAYARLAGIADIVIVEGAGGFMIPLNRRETGADLARMLQLPVILVVGMRLGCLNHALLTRRAISDYRLVCAGWVANCILPAMQQLEQNILALEDRLDCPRLGTIPHRAGIAVRDATPFLDLKPLVERHG